MSPDGKQALVARRNADNVEFWRFDVTRGTSTRFDLSTSMDPNTSMNANVSAVWAPDGKSIIFSSILFGKMLDLFRKQMDGTSNAEELLRSNEAKLPTSWSADGRFLLYSSYGGKTLTDLWVLPLFGSREPVPFLRTQFDERSGRFSPDGRWVAYVSNESGRYEVYVRPFSPNLPASGFQSGDSKWLISQNSGDSPRWSEDGRELYYIQPDGKLMSARIAAGSAFQSDLPRVLFQGIQGVSQWIPSPDGKRFLFLAPKIQDAAPITIVLNWQAGLKR
jgi:Tol biopolymer transport system component